MYDTVIWELMEQGWANGPHALPDRQHVPLKDAGLCVVGVICNFEKIGLL